MDQQQAASSGKHHIVAETPELRVVEYVMQPGDQHPWHHHSKVTDRFYCLEGLIGVSLRDTGEKTVLRPGESYAVSPGTIHCAGNAASGVSRYLLIQGIGKYDFVTDG